MGNCNLLAIVLAFWELQLLPLETCDQKMTKMRLRLVKNARKMRCFFCTFAVFIFLKFVRVVD